VSGASQPVNKFSRAIFSVAVLSGIEIVIHNYFKFKRTYENSILFTPQRRINNPFYPDLVLQLIPN